MTKLLLIRHGYSKANELKLFLGYGNMDLTEIGKKQAESTANYLKNIHIDAIYSSDLDRTIQTATPLSKIKNLPIIQNAGLREINGGKWEYMPFTEINEKYPNDWKSFCLSEENAGCTGGETFKEMLSRFYNAVLELAKNNENKTIAIFSHATTIKAFATNIIGLPITKIKDYPLPSNASVTTVEYDNGKFNLVEYSKNDFMEIKTDININK